MWDSGQLDDDAGGNNLERTGVLQPVDLVGGVSGPVPSAEEFSVTTGIEGKWLTFSLSGEWSENSITRVKALVEQTVGGR